MLRSPCYHYTSIPLFPPFYFAFRDISLLCTHHYFSHAILSRVSRRCEFPTPRHCCLASLVFGLVAWQICSVFSSSPWLLVRSVLIFRIPPSEFSPCMRCCSMYHETLCLRMHALQPLVYTKQRSAPLSQRYPSPPSPYLQLRFTRAAKGICQAKYDS